MELVQLEYFKKTAELEHISRAAEELMITQPTLSSSIQRLESELGAQLFERRGRGVKLNECGAMFLGHVNRILEQISQAKEDVHEYVSKLNSTLNIDAPSLYLIPGLMDEIMHTYPNVVISYSHEENPMPHLQSGKMDFCISTHAYYDSKIATIPLKEERIGLLVPASSPLAGRETISFSELKDYSFASMRKTTNVWKRIDQLCKLSDFNPKVLYEGNSYQDIRLAVISGHVVALTLHKPIMDTDKEVAFIPIENAEPMTLCISYPISKTDNQIIMDIIAMIKKHYS